MKPDVKAPATTGLCDRLRGPQIEVRITLMCEISKMAKSAKKNIFGPKSGKSGEIKGFNGPQKIRLDPF